jgi:hypothetical protein
MSIEELENEIKLQENNLIGLRNEYLKKTGHLPARDIKDVSWKWTIFMALGFAFISMIVFLLGIRDAGQELNTGIPELFYSTDIAYFAILTFYFIIALLVVQSDKISGYQTLVILLGFWCAHWLIYDWGWHAIKIGMGITIPNEAWWNSEFYAPLVMPRPFMWMFLTWAILGGIMSLYTFTVPKRGRDLLPTALWLYTGYANATVFEMLGVEKVIILVIGIILIIIAFSLMVTFTILRIRETRTLINESKQRFKESFKRKSWRLDPLSMPWVLVIIGMLVVMHLFLILIPVIGLFLGFIPWFLLPFFYILFRSSNARKYSKALQYVIALILIAFLIGLMVFMNFA